MSQKTSNEQVQKKQVPCPALDYKETTHKDPSFHYPFGDRVPRAIRMLCTRSTEVPGEPYVTARNGEIYAAWTNSYGAVAAVIDRGGGGKKLGLLPDEFEIVQWYPYDPPITLYVKRENGEYEESAYACSVCRRVAGSANDPKGKDRAGQCCALTKCADCGRYDGKREYYTVCDICSKKREAQEEVNRFNKATKVLAKDYDKPVFANERIGSDGFRATVDEAVEALEDMIADGELDKMPEYVWGSVEIKPKLHADSVAENLAGDMHEDWYDNISDADFAALQVALDTFCASQGSSFTVDYQTAVLLNAPAE